MPDLQHAVASGFRRFFGHAIVLLAAPVLVACSVEVDQGGGGYNPRPQPVCTQEYAPVCAIRGGERETFSNSCMARASGFRVERSGECRRGRPDTRPGEARACTREYAPVCGQRGRDRQTFANACEARSDGYNIVGRGECTRGRPDRDRDDRAGRDRPGRDRDRPGEQRVCTMEYNPVCAQRGNQRRTFGNACSADVEGFRVIRPGECAAN